MTSLPVAHDGCKCVCHSLPGIIHFRACCRPARTEGSKMRIRQTLLRIDKAEGHCCGLPYDTQLVSSQGCAIHFWVGEKFDAEVVNKALVAARGHRDIVSATWSLGEPTAFWANQDIK